MKRRHRRPAHRKWGVVMKFAGRIRSAFRALCRACAAGITTVFAAFAAWGAAPPAVF